MNRRKFLSLVSGAVAAVAGGLGLAKAAKAAKSSPSDGTITMTTNGRVDVAPFMFGTGKPRQHYLCVQDGELCWAAGDCSVTPVAFSNVSDPNDWSLEYDRSDAIILAIKKRRKESFEQLVRVNEAYCFGNIDALGGLNV